MLTRRDSLVAILTACLTASVMTYAQSDKSLMGSSIFDWNVIEVTPTKIGSTRRFFQAPTATLDELECHVTTLNPGESPACATQASRRRVDRNQGRNCRVAGQWGDEASRAWLSDLSGREPDAWNTQCRHDPGHVSRHQMELTRHAEGEDKAINAEIHGSRGSECAVQRNVAEGDKFNSRWQRHRNGR